MKKIRFIIFFVVVLHSILAKADVVDVINNVRSARNLSAVEKNKQLYAAAQHHANWLQRNKFNNPHLEGIQPRTLEEWRVSKWHPINRAIWSKYIELEDIYHIHAFGMNVIPGAKEKIGEVIAIIPNGNPNLVSPIRVVNGWLNSAWHSKKILGNFKHIGVGVSPNNRYVVVLFGKR